MLTEEQQCWVWYIQFITEELYQLKKILTLHKLNLDRVCIKYTMALGILVLINVHPILMLIWMLFNKTFLHHKGLDVWDYFVSQSGHAIKVWKCKSAIL